MSDHSEASQPGDVYDLPPPSVISTNSRQPAAHGAAQAPQRDFTSAIASPLLNDIPPFAFGTLSVPSADLVLFYGKPEGQARRINFSAASHKELELLSQACDPATFGRGPEDVLDESYRKAGKLDIDHFVARLDPPEIPGLLDAVKYGLLLDAKSTRQFSIELYKLNVYGKGAFFKSHKDTPRSEQMFGSLVVVLPTEHEGGVLNLSHQDQEWTFDSAKLLADKRVDGPCIAYVTFYSDVEHAVTEVTSGYRVTLTYNLYYSDDAPSNETSEGPVVGNEVAFKVSLAEALYDAAFLPKGGHLGFGLRYSYPLPLEKPMESVDVLKKYLKGQDAVVLKVCQELGLKTNLYLLYDIQEVDCLFDHKLKIRGEFNADSVMDSIHGLGGKVIKVRGYMARWEKPDFIVKWVTPLTKYNQVRIDYTAYGNQSEHSFSYGKVCLIVEVEPHAARTATGQD